MRLQLVRHATLIIQFAGKRLLVDPMLSDVGAMPAIENSPNQKPNPLVPLPMSAKEVVRGIDAVLVTHTHRDHWDVAATELVPKDTIIFGQAADETKFHESGFTRFQTIYTSFKWERIEITRTGAQHGTGEIGKKMAPVSGFVLRTSKEPRLYIAGDTVWCPDVKDALKKHDPEVVVVNAGAAQFLQGDPITMTADDVLRVTDAAAQADVIAVHMEAINHCVLTREQLRARTLDRVRIPADGRFAL
jgi:L-ascorbate metabolism protein UlaG (beta-lactamase superfamily)